MTDDTTPCEGWYLRIGGGWIEVRCDAHPATFNKRRQGWRAAHAEFDEHEALDLAPDPAPPTIASVLARMRP